VKPSVLFQAIKALTEQANGLAKDEKLELCFEKITERQALLEKLQRVLRQKKLLFDGSEVQAEYIELIELIQREDSQSVAALGTQRNELLGRFKKQSTIKKAMSAYHGVLLSK
tara:strand:- start:12748 stop:13086 length:339 start_codon:yes stop_codon:yes gene_type:complete